MSIEMLLDSLLDLEYLLLHKSNGLFVKPGGLFVWIDTVFSGMPAILLLSEHALGSFQSAQQMLQLLHLYWQWSPLEWVLHPGIMSQSLGVILVSLCSDSSSHSPQFDSVRVGQTYFPLSVIGKVGKGLLIPTRGFHDNQDTHVFIANVFASEAKQSHPSNREIASLRSQ